MSYELLKLVNYMCVCDFYVVEKVKILFQNIE